MEDNTSVIVQEPMMTRPMTSYADVMTYLHSLHISREELGKVGKRLVVECSSVNLSKAFSRLDHLSMLQDNWDGRGAFRITPLVIRNVKSVLSVSDDDDWKGWMISPNPNGTITLQSRKERASISIGEHEFSYFSKPMLGQRRGESHIDFSPSLLLQTMREIG